MCTVVVLDLIDVPSAPWRIPRSTWLRIQRVIEGTEMLVLLLATEPVARSAAELSIVTGVDCRGEDHDREGITIGRRIAFGRSDVPGGVSLGRKHRRDHCVISPPPDLDLSGTRLASRLPSVLPLP
ncbi:MAG: hypothetical protein R2712_11520 [Vicinamibacterales bacterium]